MRVLSVLAVLVLAASAGCVSNSSSPTSASPATTTDPAAAPTPSVEEGSIAGLLVDEEALPKAGVEVLIRPNDNTTVTDDGGRFTFNELQPGTYDILVSILGYNSVGKSVDVAAGEITEITITLVQVEIVVPYTEPFTFEGHITVGEAFLDIFTGQLGLPGCDQCTQFFNTTDTIQSVVLELWMVPTVSNPAGPTTLQYQVWDRAELNSGDLSATAYSAGAWSHGSKITLHRDDWEGKWDPEGDQFQVVHACAIEWVCVDQSFTVYGTFFHNGKAPDEFTALPE